MHTSLKMDFETVLVKCGSFGRYQFVLLLLFGFTNILSSFHFFSQTIISFTPNHWCFHEKLANLSFVDIERVYATLAQPSCTLLEDIVDGQPIIATHGSRCTEWIFNFESGYESVTTELKWICDDAYKTAVGQSVFYIGTVVGTTFFGYLADKIGRLPALILTTLSGALGDFITSFVNNLPGFAAGRFISGFSADTLYYIMFILVFEYLDAKKRTFGLNIVPTIFYCFGLMISPWVALWVGTWRHYLLVASLPALAVLIYPLLACECAQWLITKNDLKGAVCCLKRVARFNKRHVDETVFEAFVSHYERKQAEKQKVHNKKDTFWGMFRTPRMRTFTLIMLIKSMVIVLTFDIVSRNMEGLGTSPFKLFSLTAIVFIPGGMTLILLQNVIGRKGMAFSSLLVGGIITALTGFMIAFLDRTEHAVLLGVMVALGRYGINVSYDAEAQYAAELIPTSVRGRALSNIHMVGYAISFLSPYVIYLGNFYKPLPSIFTSVIMLIGAALCLLLPETMNKKLPETLSEGETFGFGEKWYFFPCIGQKGQHTRVPTTDET